MKLVRCINLLTFFHSCGCAVLNVEEELQPLDLPADYEQKMKAMLPQLLKQVGVSAVSIPSDDGFLASSWSTFSNGVACLKFWDNSKQYGERRI